MDSRRAQVARRAMPSLLPNFSNLSEKVKALKPDNVTFIQGDSFALEKSLSSQFLSKLPHP